MQLTATKGHFLAAKQTNKVVIKKIALQHSAPALFLALWESVSLCPEGVPPSLLWQGLLESHHNEVLGCFAIGLAVPDSSGTHSASLWHTQLLRFISLCSKINLQPGFPVASMCCGHGSRAPLVKLVEKAVTTARGVGVIEEIAGNLHSRRQPLHSPPCFPRVQTALIPPKISHAVGTLPARGDERDGSEAKSSRLTQGVSEAAKTHPSNVSAWLSQRECSRLCLHGKIVLVSFRV